MWELLRASRCVEATRTVEYVGAGRQNCHHRDAQAHSAHTRLQDFGRTKGSPRYLWNFIRD